MSQPGFPDVSLHVEMRQIGKIFNHYIEGWAVISRLPASHHGWGLSSIVYRLRDDQMNMPYPASESLPVISIMSNT